MIRAFFGIVVSLLVSVVVSAAPPVTLTRYITDETGALDQSQIQRMTQVSTELEQKTGIQLVTYVTRSLNGNPIETAAEQVFSASGIGDKKKDQGVLLMVAPSERRVRIEVGYGLEGELPDGRAGQIIDQRVLSFFKSKDIAGGVESGHMAIATHLASSRGVTLNGAVTPPQKSQHRGSILGLLILVAAVVLMSRGRGGILPWIILGGMGNNDRWGGGGFGGGGFGGFGGGMSGGGGASRGW